LFVVLLGYAFAGEPTETDKIMTEVTQVFTDLIEKINKKDLTGAVDYLSVPYTLTETSAGVKHFNTKKEVLKHVKEVLNHLAKDGVEKTVVEYVQVVPISASSSQLTARIANYGKKNIKLSAGSVFVYNFIKEGSWKISSASESTFVPPLPYKGTFQHNSYYLGRYVALPIESLWDVLRFESPVYNYSQLVGPGNGVGSIRRIQNFFTSEADLVNETQIARVDTPTYKSYTYNISEPNPFFFHEICL